MSSITSVILSFIYLKREREGKCRFVSFFFFIVFEENVLTVTVEGEMRVFKAVFYEKPLNLVIQELEKTSSHARTSHTDKHENRTNSISNNRQ